MVTADIGCGYVALQVDLNIDISIAAFVGLLEAWTSSWIAGDQQGFWSQVNYCPVSPEDKGAPLMVDAGRKLSADACHHIILITSRQRLLIPVKYRGLMALTAADAAHTLGAEVRACAAMRNHLHLLLDLPSRWCLSQFVDALRAVLLQRMLSDRHLRCAQGWSEDSVAYTVSPSRIIEEEHTIACQNSIHRWGALNEMSPLYQRLDIPYISPLH